MEDNERVFSAPRGTRDLLPPESRHWQHVMRTAMDVFAGAGYQPVETPAFEHTEVFERGVGESSEVVGKQMYTFVDKAGRSLTLRPEGTAPVVRAALEHDLHRGPLPLKLAYAGPMWRQERPQKGRYRQFWQAGIEAIGSEDPALDAEVVDLGRRVLEKTGVEARVLLNSIGHPSADCRLGYIEKLRSYLSEREGDLAEEDRRRIETNALRTFDSKEPATITVMETAPVVTDHLCDACRGHFESVRERLDDIGVAYEMEPRLVRGLDYYNRTAFEYAATGLGAQDVAGGGGRYDGLAESLGGPPLAGIGLALGIDRIMLASATEAVPRTLDVYVVAVGDAAVRTAFKLATSLREAGASADLDFSARSLKGQMKDAARSGARWAAILGDEEIGAGEVTLKDLESGTQERIALTDLRERVRRETVSDRLDDRGERE